MPGVPQGGLATHFILYYLFYYLSIYLGVPPLWAHVVIVANFIEAKNRRIQICGRAVID